MKLEVGDVVKMAKRRWYLGHRKEFYAGMLMVFLAAALLLGGMIAGDENAQDAAGNGSTWEWSVGAVILLTLATVAIIGWFAWLLYWSERRNDYTRSMLAEWVETEIKQGQVRDKRGKFAKTVAKKPKKDKRAE